MAPVANAAYTVNINRHSDYFAGDGGEFTIDPGNGLEFVLDNYKPVAKYSSAAFQSFCLEKKEYVNLPADYEAIINTDAVKGGNLVSDPISKGTAYLYYYFAQGLLKGDSAEGSNDNSYSYTYSLTGSQRNTDAQMLQNAIWYLEGEIAKPAGNKFLSAAINEFGDETAAKAPNWVGGVQQTPFPVKALNLWDDADVPSGYHQDQLVVVPEPTTYIAGGLLGLPFILGAWRMRSAKRAMAA